MLEVNEVNEVNEKERNAESDVLRFLEMRHYSVRTELVEVFKNPSTGSGRTVGIIKASNVESFCIRLNLVMRFFLGEIGLQKYYLAQWRW